MKFKKIISITLAAVMALSAMCMGTSAKEVYQLKNGAKLITYSDGEYIPRANITRAVDTSFDVVLPVYPNSALVANNLLLDNAESNIEICFTEEARYGFYLSIYDLTTGEYLTAGPNNMQGPSGTSVATCTNLTGGHKYRIRMAASIASGRVAGTITSY